MGLYSISQHPLELICARIVNIKIDEIYPIVVLNLEPVNHRRQSLAPRSPEGKELNQGGLSAGEIHRDRICGNQPSFQFRLLGLFRWGDNRFLSTSFRRRAGWDTCPLSLLSGVGISLSNSWSFGKIYFLRRDPSACTQKNAQK